MGEKENGGGGLEGGGWWGKRRAEQTYSQLPLDLNKTHKSQARRDKHTHKYCYVMRQQDPVSGRGASSPRFKCRIGGRWGVGKEREKKREKKEGKGQRRIARGRGDVRGDLCSLLWL